MFDAELNNFMDVAKRLGFQLEYIDYEAVIQKERDEVRRKRDSKNPRLLALMGPPVPSITAIDDEAPLPPSVTGSYSVVFDEAVKTYKIKDSSSGDFRWYPKHGMKPSIDKSATGITILTDADGGTMIAADLFGAGAIVGGIGWLLGV